METENFSLKVRGIFSGSESHKSVIKSFYQSFNKDFGVSCLNYCSFFTYYMVVG